MDSLLKFLEEYQRITIVCHPNADPDCIGSAYAISSALESLRPEPDVAITAPEDVSTPSKKLIQYLQVEISPKLPMKSDLFLLVDTCSVERVHAVKDAVEREGVPYAIVDHHVSDRDAKRHAAFSFVRKRSSACQVVFEALGSKVLGQKALQALLVGLIYDSRRFLILPNESICFASKLIRLGADANLALRLLSPEEDPSEKMARLKGATRLRLFRVGDWTIATTRVGSFEASVARALISLGADVALALNDSGAETRLSGRSSDAFLDKTGIDLASDVMGPLAEDSGHGGGHPTAASAGLAGSCDDIVSRALELISRKLPPNDCSIKEIHTKK